ncbi:polysaccharide deacetylase family protein [Oceanibacterium hippocampi]|uniref:Chitooligosaccharide deacetylase n=1 Tax=Oceanibacterium hippocampi TaxID=745714 RepID=A0A1Y5RKC5_9PROT|nr:polysaccharide deacetylase family protein [Oceanibacterium hippocampi]SLN19562.1 Polysaccharide deacetylase [Oceanibacterium hippocampi]
MTRRFNPEPGRNARTRRERRRRIHTGLIALLSLALLVAADAGARAADWATVVMYHRFGEDSAPSTNIRLDQFDVHLAELASGAYTPMAVDAILARLAAGEALPDRTVAITVDDAFLSVYTEAWPRLKAAGIPFTLFVATEPIDQGLAGYMTWDQIRELAADGVTIGSQTAAHPHMPAMSAERNREELARSNARFEAELGSRPTLFAYPYGEYGNAVREIVAEAGFAAAFGQHSGVMHGGMDAYSLPRFAMNEKYGSIGRFRLAVNAMPLRVRDLTPADTVLRQNPPLFGFTIDDEIDNLDQLACFASNQSGPATIERLGQTRFEVRLDGPFAAGRGRVNCTLPGPDRRWRWYGIQFFIPG